MPPISASSALPWPAVETVHERPETTAEIEPQSKDLNIKIAVHYNGLMPLGSNDASRQRTGGLEVGRKRLKELPGQQGTVN